MQLPSTWQTLNGGILAKTAHDIARQLRCDGQIDAILPRREDVFRAFEMVAPEAVSVIIIGQDPYPSEIDAMGLAFSSRSPKVPASLRNIFRELMDDLGTHAPATCDLSGWARQGVLLANTTLTLGINGQAHHHLWAQFTRQWIQSIAAARPAVWILWGNHAQKLKPSILEHGAHLPHAIIESVHPSPLSARRGFFGSKPFSKANAALENLGKTPIDWSASA